MKTFKQYLTIEISEELLTEKNWIKAYKIHSKMENAAGNKMWKTRHATAAFLGAGVAAGLASKDYGMAAVNLGNGLMLAANHISHIRQVKKELDHRDKRTADRAEDAKHMEKWNAEQSARQAVRDKKNQRRRELYAAKKKKK